MRQKKKEKGITLIALVVTIVVLIILASISIALLRGNNGILSNAKDAKNNTEISEEKELLQVSVESAIDKNVWGNLTEEDLDKALEENIGKGKYNLETEEDRFKVTYTETNRSYYVNNEKTVIPIDVADEDDQEETTSKEVSVTIEETNYVYDGTEKKPTVQIKYQDILLAENEDYTLIYENNKNAGTATIKISYNEPYYGEEALTFQIQKRQLIIETPTMTKNDDGTPLTNKRYSYRGNVPGEIPVFTGELSGIQIGPGSSPNSIGTLQIHDSSTFLVSNYQIDCVIGILTINPVAAPGPGGTPLPTP